MTTMTRSMVLILAALAVNVATATEETNVWTCVTKEGNSITLLEPKEATPILHYKNNQVEVNVFVPDPRKEWNDRVTAHYGYAMYPRGESEYYRFNYMLEDETIVDWVLFDGESHLQMFQGIRVYQNGELVIEDECKNYAETRLAGHSLVTTDHDETLVKFGSIE